MATYVNNLRLKEIATGDESGTWGTSTNTNLELITDGFSYGTKQMAADANETFTMPDATADATRGFYLKITSAGALTATREVTLGPNTVSKVWMIENATSGSQIITIKQGSGATVNVANGSKVMVVTDGAGAGAAVLNANPTEVGGTVTSVAVSGGTTGLTTSGGPVTTSGTITLAGTLAVANGGTGVTSSTGTGSVVLSTNPTFAGLTTTADMSFGDNDKAIFGASNDLQLYHDGSNSYIDDAGAGSLLIRGTNLQLRSYTTNENFLTGTENGAVSLYYDGTIKAATISTGLDVTGTVRSDSLSDGGGVGKINYDSSSFFSGAFSDEVTALGNTGTAVTIDCDDGNVFTATLTGNATITLATPNSTANRATSFTLVLTNDATASRTVAFAGGTFKYPGGSVSRTTDANATDIWFFFSPDNGTNWYVSIPMKNLSS
ncbi:MAG: hypothetical protein CMA72_06130 [Euryarchaeota archaeon]|mgnify:CR=1 FL=1|nr:hypothetical protein [Euryarchaeota archaeon]